MNQSNEVGKASGEETGMGGTMEGVVTKVDAMTSAVDSVEAMVKAVEMREWLEVGRTETERTTAVHFFSRALAVQKQKDDIQGSRRYILPLYCSGHLHGLDQLLSDCLLPHNSKAIQSDAMLSIRGLILTHNLSYDVRGQASDHLFRLVRETECTKIRDQATWLLGRMSLSQDQYMDLLPLLIDLVRKYAAILEPTDTEISSLNTALKALKQVLDHFHMTALGLGHVPELELELSLKPHMLNILSVLVGIFKEPGNHKKAQIRALQSLGIMAYRLDGNFFLDSGVIGVLLETVRVGKEPTGVLVHSLVALEEYFIRNTEVVELRKEALGVFHLVLKRPNDSFKWRQLWGTAVSCLGSVLRGSTVAENVEALLSQDGLVELVLNLALGMEMSEETRWHHMATHRLLSMVARNASDSESQIRRLMLKGPLFPLLNRYLNWEGMNCHEDHPRTLRTVLDCLDKCPEANQRILRRLIHSSGLTNSIIRICDVGGSGDDYWLKVGARYILDTYLNNPPPPPPPHNLPTIIYTRNMPPN